VLNRRLVIAAIGGGFWMTTGPAALAQTAPAATDRSSPMVTMVPHNADAPLWLSGQLNIIGQGHGTFQAPYSGPNSLQPGSEFAVSSVWTVDVGVRATRRVDFWFDLESAGGGGISTALGLAGFTNLDVVRNPTLGSTPYVARVMVHGTIPIGSETATEDRRPWSFGTTVPARRIEFRVGKMSLADYFDLNRVGSDSHLQFTNWTVDNSGAYDYAADTRGYTYAAVVEYIVPRWSLRGAVALMPTVANGIDLDGNLARARGVNLELELRPSSNRTLRFLGYRNRANMGRYQEAIDAFLAGRTLLPDVVATRQQGRIKSGGGLNVDYATGPVRLFSRIGGNEGENESFAYTEVNHTVTLGGDVDGAAWRRAADRAGVAFVSNGISSPHQEYLRLGGLGFLLGDGTLSYGRETIVEGYYTAHLWRGLFASADFHHVANPGYNRDRGPVLVSGLRLHVDY